MEKKILGFGMMRLPVRNGNPADIDFKELNQMVDVFLEAGFTYFDTSFVYHNGESENAVRKSLIERYPHQKGGHTVATKFPTFAYQEEKEIEPIFQKQLKKLGIDYVDYYLLHNIQTILYDGIDGNGGVIKRTNLFDHAREWLDTGKIRHLGISFHSSAKLLDRILSEHPEIEFVQLAVNYIDWTGELVQAEKCCEVVRKHRRKLIIMEPVKGGMLSNLPKEAADIMTEYAPQKSLASWALRFVSGIDNDILAILSGMSNLQQMYDNIQTMSNLLPLSEAEAAILQKAIHTIGEKRPIPTSEIEKCKGLFYHGVPVTALLDGYSTCQMEPNPGFSDINNYPKNALAENSHFDFLGSRFSKERFVRADDVDVSETVNKAILWLKENSF